MGRDRALQVGLVAIVLTLLALLVARMNRVGYVPDLVGLIDPILLTMTVAALFWGRKKLTGSNRRFWDQLGCAWSALLLVDVFFFFDLSVPYLPASFVTDALHVLFYLLLALAIDLRPHLTEAFSLSMARLRLESVAGLMVVFGLLFYFALAVQGETLGLSLSFVPRERGISPLLLVRLSLDLLILGRLIYAGTRSGGRWRKVYFLLAAAVSFLAVKDALAIAQSEGVVALASLGFTYQVFLVLPAALVIFTARYGHRHAADLETNELTALTPPEKERLDASPLALYALVVPGMHFLLYSLDLLEPASRGPREVFCLIYLVVLGATAWLHQLLITQDNERAREALFEAEVRLARSERLESIGRLAGGIAHDLNNYLTVIQGYSELVRESQDDPEAATDIGFVQEAAESAGNLTRQLLAFGRRQLLRPQPLDLNEVLTNTAKMLESLLGEDIDLDLDLDPQTGLVLADIGQTEQVFANLALNGRDAMPDGGKLSVRTRPVEVSEGEAVDLEVEPGLYAELLVADTGVGMTEEVRAQVFDPFFTTKSVGRGTGLGLSTVYGVVSQSGGSVEIQSVVDEGTRIRVLLPRSEEAIKAEPVRLTPAPDKSGNEIVLLVEDEQAVKRLAERALKRRGMRVLSASNGKEALSVLSAHEGTIDLLITDVMMPEMDGLELATFLGQSMPELPVLFISGYPAATLRERRTELPPSAPLLHKPFTASALVREVQRLLEPS